MLCSMNAQRDLTNLTLCLHEDIHTADAPRKGHGKSYLRTVDTYVVVIATASVGRLNVDELRIAFASGKSFRVLAVHEIETVWCIPFVHAFTECDTMSAFAWHGKKSSWDVWRSFTDVTRTLKFVTLSDMPDEVLAEDFKTLERFAHSYA